MEDGRCKRIHSHWSLEEVQCKEHFISTHKRDAEGRFIVKLPLKGNIKSLGKSYNVATKCLRTLEEKLDKQPDLKQHEFLYEYLELSRKFIK